MSATNWATCPRCFKRAVERHDETVRLAAEGYGKLPVAEWQELDRQAQIKPSLNNFESNLREDYELWIDGKSGTFEMYYGCECDECGFKHSYRHKEAVDI